MEDQGEEFAFSFQGSNFGHNQQPFTFGQSATFAPTSSPFLGSPTFSPSPFGSIGPPASITPTPFAPTPSFSFNSESDDGEKEKEAVPQSLFGPSASVLLDEFSIGPIHEPSSPFSFPTNTATSQFAPSFAPGPFAFGHTPSSGEKHESKKGTTSFSFQPPPSIQTDQGERKILRAKRSELKGKEKEREQGTSPDRKILRARRTNKPSYAFDTSSAPGEEKEHNMVNMLSFTLRCNGRSTRMTRALVIRGFTPNGRYMLTHDRDPGKRSWYLWRESVPFGTWDLSWKCDSNKEVLFFTNECLVLFHGGDDKYPVISQYTLLDDDMYQQRNFVGQKGLMSCHEQKDNDALELCCCFGVRPCFSGILDPRRSIGLVIATGEQADCDIVTTFQITGLGLQQLGSCPYPRGTFPADGVGLEVVALPQADTFVVLNARTKNPKFGCVSYNYSFESDPKDKETGPVPLSQHEWETLERYPHKRVLNIASYLHELIPHPVYPVSIVTNEASGSDPTVYEGFNMSVFGGVTLSGPDDDLDDDALDFHTIHRGRNYVTHGSRGGYDDDEDEGDDEEEGEETEEEEEEEEEEAEEEEEEGNQNAGMRQQFSFMSFSKEDAGDGSPSVGYDSVD